MDVIAMARSTDYLFTVINTGCLDSFWHSNSHTHTTFRSVSLFHFSCLFKYMHEYRDLQYNTTHTYTYMAKTFDDNWAFYYALKELFDIVFHKLALNSNHFAVETLCHICELVHAFVASHTFACSLFHIKSFPCSSPKSPFTYCIHSHVLAMYLHVEWNTILVLTSDDKTIQ